MMSASQIRNERLAQISQMVINGEITHKLDHIATISINSRFYFNVFRRYNSPYNIVIEDRNMDFYFHQDHTVRKSLQTVLCLTEYDAGYMYTWNATSFKHNGPIPSLDKDIADMRWSEIQGRYHAVSVNFGGIFYDIPATLETPPVDILYDAPPQTPRDQMIPSDLTPPDAPERPKVVADNKVTAEDNETANILLSLSIPRTAGVFHMSESDGPTLSMRFADIAKRKNVPVCYCEMDEDDDDDDVDDDETVDENNYTVLRSGSMIPKIIDH
jgi:hypothetical protein